MKQINNWMGALIVAVVMLSSGTVFAKSVSIGTLPQGSLAYGIASLVAKVISENSDLVTRAVGIGGSDIFISQVNQGKVELYQVPEEPSDKEEAAEKPAAKPAHTLGLLTLDRQDPKEAWLIQSLLAVESDLKDLTEPMVFAVYGRARALPPYVGKGITKSQLV